MSLWSADAALPAPTISLCRRSARDVHLPKRRRARVPLRKVEKRAFLLTFTRYTRAGKKFKETLREITRRWFNVAKGGADGADLCSHEAVQETAEKRKLYATKRAQRSSEQAGGGGRAGNSGTNGGRAVRLARRQATETAAREHGRRRRGEAAEAARSGQRRRTTTTIARKRTPSRYSNPTVHTYHRESPRSSSARGAVGFHPTG